MTATAHATIRGRAQAPSEVVYSDTSWSANAAPVRSGSTLLVNSSAAPRATNATASTMHNP